MRAVVALALGGALALTGASSAGGMKVWVRVDFGPAGKAPIQRELSLPPGATVLDAVRAVAQVEQAVACCHPRDLSAIGGAACDRKAGAYWTYEVDGQKGAVPAFRYVLAEGDRVVWKYRVIPATGK